eukprot:2142220-Rhodomonas_salina.3
MLHVVCDEVCGKVGAGLICGALLCRNEIVHRCVRASEGDLQPRRKSEEAQRPPRADIARRPQRVAVR